MRLSGFAAMAVAVAGVALMPATASAAVFTLNQCATGDCGNFTGSVTIAITDNVSDTNDVNFTVTNNSNGDIDYLRFGYVTPPTGAGQITNFSANPVNSVGAPSASFGSGNDAGFAYNVDVDFPNAAGSRFDAGEAVSFTLGSTSNFNFNASGFSPVLAHVISLSIGGQSVKITTGGGGSNGGGNQNVPEPASMALFGFAALAVGNRMRRRGAK
jgi:hypothetical protein